MNKESDQWRKMRIRYYLQVGVPVFLAMLIGSMVLDSWALNKTVTNWVFATGSATATNIKAFSILGMFAAITCFLTYLIEKEFPVRPILPSDEADAEKAHWEMLRQEIAAATEAPVDDAPKEQHSHLDGAITAARPQPTAAHTLPRDADKPVQKQQTTSGNRSISTQKSQLGIAVFMTLGIAFVLFGVTGVAVVIWKIVAMTALNHQPPQHDQRQAKQDRLPVDPKPKPDLWPGWNGEPDWKQLNFRPGNDGVKDMSTFLRLRPEQRIETQEQYDGPIELTVIARTERNNVRLSAFAGGLVILNWEVNPHELRIHRPDGNDKGEGCTLGTALFTPLAPNRWYRLNWRIQRRSMNVSVNGKIVYTEMHEYNLNPKRPVGVLSADSTIDVTVFRVTRLDM